MSAKSAAPAPSVSDDFHAGVLTRLVSLAKQPVAPKVALLNALRWAAKHRALLLQNTLLKAYGPTILGGPFAGMSFVRQVAEGCCVPKLLGCYEEELHPYVEQAILRDYPQVLNIGVAEGYYAVGFARRMPNAKVFAFDIDENTRWRRPTPSVNGCKLAGYFGAKTSSATPTSARSWCATSKAPSASCSIPRRIPRSVTWISSSSCTTAWSPGSRPRFPGAFRRATR